MKIRTGFISNSSSSSFCFLGKSVSRNEVRELVSKGKRVVAIKEAGGTSGEVEDFIAEITDKNIEAIFAYEKFEFFLIDHMIYDDDDDEPFEIPKEITTKIYYFNRDYSSANNPEEISKWVRLRNDY